MAGAPFAFATTPRVDDAPDVQPAKPSTSWQLLMPRCVQPRCVTKHINHRRC